MGEESHFGNHTPHTHYYLENELKGLLCMQKEAHSPCFCNVLPCINQFPLFIFFVSSLLYVNAMSFVHRSGTSGRRGRNEEAG